MTTMPADGSTRPDPAAWATTVVLPCHNGAATLADQLGMLADQVPDLAFEVLVVDNNSTDGSADVARGFADRIPGLRVIRATEGASVAYARNAGAREAASDNVVFCDADDWVRPGWVLAMTRALAVDDVVGGGLDVTRINAADAQAWVGHPPQDALPVCMKYRPYATGANFGVRLAVWQDLGGFDETYQGGHEEVDFCWRAADRGYTVGFAEGSLVDYRLRDTRRGVVRQRVAYGRTYAQLYGRFRDHPIPRTSVRHEVKVVAMFLAEGPGEWRAGRLTHWLAGVAWTWGRYRGDLAHRVRCPL